MAIKPLNRIYPYLKHIFKNAFSNYKGLGKHYLYKELDYASGLETVAENPSELLTDKGQDEAFYDTMLLDNTIATAIDLKKAITLSVDGSVKPSSDAPDDRERAEWLDKMLYRMRPDIWKVFDNALDAWAYGFKCGEKIFKVGKEGEFEGKWIIDEVKFMHSNYFDFLYDKYGTLDGLWIGKDYGGTEIVKGFNNIMSKFLILPWPYPIDGNWYGRSDLDAVYLQYYQKYQIYRWRGIYLQGFGMPVIVAKYEQGKMSSSELSDLDDQLANWQEQMYFKIPSIRPKKGDKAGELLPKIELELLEKDNTSTDAYENAIKQLDADIKRRLLIPDNVGFSDNRKGSLSQSKTELDILFKIIGYTLDVLEDFINPTIRQVERLNYGEVENPSEWKFDEITPKMEAEIVKVLIEQKVIDPREKWVRPYLGIPSITVEEEEELDKQGDVDKEEPVPPQPPVLPKSDEHAPAEDAPSIADAEESENMTTTASSAVTYKKKTNPFDAKKALKVYEDTESGFIKQYDKLHKENEKRVVKKTEGTYSLDPKDYKWVADFRIAPVFKKALRDSLTLFYYDLFFKGREDAMEETKDKLPEKMQIDYNMTPGDLKSLLEEQQIKEFGDLGMLTREEAQDLRNLQQRAFTLVGDDERRQLKGITSSLRESLDSDRPLRETVARLRSNMSDDRKRYAKTIARTNASSAYNAGRASWFNSPGVSPFIVGYEYSAVLDDRTTEFCRAHDGQVIKKEDPMLQLVWPPNHFSCRSTMVAIMAGDEEDPNSYYHNYENNFEAFGEGVPKNAMKPADGFGG